MAAGGDADAFGALYQRHRHALHRYCRSILGDDDDARDALHNAMAKAWAAIGRADRDVPVRPWLFRIAHNEALNVLRDRREHRQLDDARVSSMESLEETIDVRQRLAVLRADLAALPERQRSALLLRELCGLRHNEIATVLAITPAAARQTIYEARVGLHEAEAGRQMPCAAVQRALSDGDGQVRRRRKIRGHLRACPACASFDEGLRRRPSELAGLVGPTPAAPLGVLARVLTHVGNSGGTSAITKLSSGLATNLAVGSVVVTVSTVGSLETSVNAEPGVRAVAAHASTAPANLAGAAGPYLPGELRDGRIRPADEPATPQRRAPTPPPQDASVAVPAATHEPNEAPPAVTADDDAAAGHPVVVTAHHADPSAAAPAQPATARPSSGSGTAPSVPPRPAPVPSGPGVPSGAPDEPRPTPPARDPRTPTPSNGSGERGPSNTPNDPHPAHPTVEQPDRRPDNGPDDPHPARGPAEQPDRRPDNGPDDPHPARGPAEQPDRRPDNGPDDPHPAHGPGEQPERGPAEQPDRRPDNRPQEARSPTPTDDRAGPHTDSARPAGPHTDNAGPQRERADRQRTAPADATASPPTRPGRDPGPPPRSAASERP
jgi:RNA polymerase sigma factor (sigma-70 family)